MGLDLCRASHVKRPCATSYLVGSKLNTYPLPLGRVCPTVVSVSTPALSLLFASAFDGWVEVGGFGCRPLVGRGYSRAPVDLMRGTFMAPRMRVHRKHAIFWLARQINTYPLHCVGGSGLLTSVGGSGLLTFGCGIFNSISGLLWHPALGTA